jgi:hypothetical protein
LEADDAIGYRLKASPVYVKCKRPSWDLFDVYLNPVQGNLRLVKISGIINHHFDENPGKRRENYSYQR